MSFEKANRNFDTFANPERALPQVDCVVVLGRGIEKVGTSSGQVWKPTRYIQELVAKTEGGFTRTGERKPLRSDTEKGPHKLFVAGGTANTLAGIEFFNEMRERGTMPRLFILAAGRPDYLKNEPEGLTEGAVMKKVFERRVTNFPETIVLSENKNTRDDVLNSLRTAKERGLASVLFVNTTIAMKRTKEFYKDLMVSMPELANIRVSFITSEDLVRRRFSSSEAASAALEKILTTLQNTSAWRTTKKMEGGGIGAIRAGKYRGRGNY